MSFLARVNVDDLTTLRELIETGKVRPVVDRTYPMTQVADALAYVESGGAKGKVIVVV